MSKKLVFDIECDGFLYETEYIHMIVTEDLITGEIKCYHNNQSNIKPWDGIINAGVKTLAQADVLCGHNIKMFDIPVLKKLRSTWGFHLNPKQIHIDTISLSRLMFPSRFQHTLESWAKTLKTPMQKVQNENWTEATQNMLDRCIADVQINTILLRYLQRKVDQHAKEETQWLPSLFLEQEICAIHAEQTQVGVWYDVEKAKKTLKVFDPILKSLRDKITEGVPPCIDPPGITKPKRILAAADPEGYKGVAKPFKKDRTPAAVTVKWFEGGSMAFSTKYGAKTMLQTVKGRYCKIAYRPFSPDSDPEIKDYLYTLGWTPDEWNTKKQPNGSYKKMSPKLSESSFGSLPPGLGQTVKEYRTLKHRRGLIQSIKNPDTAGALCRVRDDGRVPANAITCGTPTARYRHSGAVCNIPRPSSDYGEEIRSLYGVDPIHWQVGVDLSGIEARMLAHGCFQFPGGPAFAELILTKQDGGWHQANADLWNCSRDDAKTELYALMFGAGPLKLGNILSRSPAEGKRNKERFMNAYKPYALLEDQLRYEQVMNQGWIQGIDGRRLYVRNKKDVLNTYTQGNAAILFKYWLVEISKIRASATTRIEQIIAYHDEGQFELYTAGKLIAEDFGRDCERLAIEAGRHFNINVEINAEAKVGKNWAECH